MALIDVTVPGFLLSEPPPKGTQDAQIPAPLAAKPLYSQEPPLPSDDEAKDFKVFYQQEDPADAPNTSCPHLKPAKVSANQEAINILERMGFEEKTPDLLALLTAHARGSFLPMPVVTWSSTPAPTRTSFVEAVDKKRKRAQGGKDIEGVEEGKVTQSSHQPPAKEARTRKG